MALISGSFGRPGQDNGTGAVQTNLLKVFAGEVITAFEAENKLLGMTQVKNVTGGAISWTWPVVGHGSISYHTPGANILTDNDSRGAGFPYLKSIKTAQRVIHMDKKIVEPLFFDELDQKLAHWDWRQKVAASVGGDIGRAVDLNIYRLMWQCGAANGGATVTGGWTAGGTFGSSRINLAAALTSVTTPALVKSFFDAKLELDKKFVPRKGRHIVMAPEVMQRLLFTEASPSAIAGLQWVDRDYGSGAKPFETGSIPVLAGFALHEMVNIDFSSSGLAATYGVYDQAAALGAAGGVAQPTDNLYDSSLTTTNNSVASNNDYAVTYATNSSPIALCFQEEAVATVKLEDLTIQSEYMIEYQGDVTVAKMCLGHGILRPECIVAIGDFT